MKAYILMANGFEVLETFAPIDVLKRCGAEVVTVSLSKDLVVNSSQSNMVIADILFEVANFDDGDLLVLPGGYPGYVNLRENKKVVDIVREYIEKEKYVAAICGAPTIFSHNNLALGRKMTAHSSTKEEILKNHIYVDSDVCVDKNIITGIGAGHSLDFAFVIAKQFFSEEKISEVKKGMELI